LHSGVDDKSCLGHDDMLTLKQVQAKQLTDQWTWHHTPHNLNYSLYIHMLLKSLSLAFVLSNCSCCGRFITYEACHPSRIYSLCFTCTSTCLIS